MRCTRPRTVGFKADGKTIAWSQRQRSKEYATFQLPCSKCIQCRLEYARGWAMRSVHEALMHEENCFVTLTYSDDHVTQALDYTHFQNFMKTLRKTLNQPIGMIVAGEYGEKTKRAHWHAIIFGWRPRDAEYKYSNERGDKVFSSKTLEKIWGKGIAEFGSVTFHSAGYVARYAAKKLVHGKDDEHTFQPIFKMSNKQAIGKTWLEKFYWSDCFAKGYLTLENGKQTGIPRYYEKWLKDHKPAEWLRYVTDIKSKKIQAAEKAALKEKKEENEYRWSRCPYAPNPTPRIRVKESILNARFKQLQQFRKL